LTEDRVHEIARQEIIHHVREAHWTPEPRPEPVTCHCGRKQRGIMAGLKCWVDRDGQWTVHNTQCPDCLDVCEVGGTITPNPARAAKSAEPVPVPLPTIEQRCLRCNTLMCLPVPQLLAPPGYYTQVQVDALVAEARLDEWGRNSADEEHRVAEAVAAARADEREKCKVEEKQRCEDCHRAEWERLSGMECTHNDAETHCTRCVPGWHRGMADVYSIELNRHADKFTTEPSA